MSYEPPDSPSEAHRRLYHRVIEPLRQELDGDAYYELTRTVLDTFLIPLDLSMYPITFGPEDEDPFYPVRAHAKKIDHRTFLANIVAGAESQAILRDAFNASRRIESMTVLQRLGKTVAPPFDPSSELKFGPMKARSVRELRALKERLTPPRTVKQLFLPSSRYFMSGFASISRVAPPHVTPLDAIDAMWRLDPEVGQVVKSITLKAQATAEATLDKVWGRWSSLDKDMIDWRSLKLPPPLFPMREEPPVILYDQSARLVASSTPLNGAAEARRPSLMAWDVFAETQDIDPYSALVLDEFDEIHFEELSATTRRSEPSRSERLSTSQWSRSEQPIAPWKHSSSIYVSEFSRDWPSAITSTFNPWTDYESRGHDNGGGFLAPKQQYEGHWDNDQYLGAGEMDQQDDAMWDDLEGLALPASDHFTGYPGSIHHWERFDPASRSSRFAQPWTTSSPAGYLHSPASLSTRVPLGHDFARHNLDWNAPLQTSPSRASPIKMQQLPTPDSNAFFQISDYPGPARTLTYGDAPRPSQQSFWRAPA